MKRKRQHADSESGAGRRRTWRGCGGEMAAPEYGAEQSFRAASNTAFQSGATARTLRSCSKKPDGADPVLSILLIGRRMRKAERHCRSAFVTFALKPAALRDTGGQRFGDEVEAGFPQLVLDQLDLLEVPGLHRNLEEAGVDRHIRLAPVVVD